jgi:UDP-glucuronate decarboxylase
MTGRRPDSEHAVVTGGAGFIGSNVCERLLSDGFGVTAIDNFASGRPENVAHLRDDPQFESVQADVRNPLPSFESVDYVLHFASRASPDDFQNHPVEIALTNSVGMRNALDLAVEHDACFVYASTSEVYGNPEVHPQRESYNGYVDPRGPRAQYDESKRFGETLGKAYVDEYGLDFRTMRIFNTYGPRMRADDGRVIPNFVTQALAERALTIYGDGTQTRSFCYVDDLVEGVRAVMETPEMSGEVVNLGNTNEITINTLAETVIDVTDSATSVTHEDRPSGDPDLRCPDIERAKTMLDWEPRTSLEAGLEHTAEYFEELSD